MFGYFWKILVLQALTDSSCVTLALTKSITQMNFTLFSSILGLFHQMILESGSDLADWALNGIGQKPETYTTQVAKKLNCPTSNSKEMMDCLRSKNFDEIREISIQCTVGL